jgi:NADH-quinone oxidoreductase subunit M
MTPWLTLLILAPLLGAASLWLVPARWVKPWALLVSLVPLALVAVIWQQFNPAQVGLQLIETHSWVPQLGLFYRLGIDGIALPLLALTALLVPLCVLVSWPVTTQPRGFMALLLVLSGLTYGVFCAQDFILFYLFFEASLIPLYLLIGKWGGENRVYAAVKFFLYTFAGSVLMLVAGLWLYSHTGSFHLLDWQGLNLPMAVQALLFVGFLLAFAVKIPMWPLHTWLPDAHVQAPTAGSVLLAGILLKLGAYGLLRFNLPMLPDATALFAPVMMTLGAIAVVWAALVAWAQTDIKKLIAYSSVSHMGLVTLGLFAGTAMGLNGALLIMLNHGIVSAGLFLVIGVLYDRYHTRDVAQLGGLVQPMPGLAAVTMVLMLAAVALPGTNGFVGEFLALAGSWPISPWATAAATSGVVLGALYMLWWYRGLMFGATGSTVQAHPHVRDLSTREWAIFTPLLLLVPVLGLAPNLAMNLWVQPVNQLVAQATPARALALPSPTTPTITEAQP